MPQPFKENFADLRTAPFSRRLGALVYDLLIVLALWFVVGLIAVAINDGEAVTGPLFQAGLFVLTYLMLAHFWTRSGQTPGMLAWRIRIQTLNGERISLMQSLIRYLVSALSLGCLGAGYLWVLVSSDRQAWHDIAARCCVVELPKENPRKRG